MREPEKMLIDEFLEKHKDEYKYYDREVSLSLPMETAVAKDGWEHRAVSKMFNRISVDVVLYDKEYKDKVYLLEAKTELNRAVIGDLITAKVVYSKLYPKRRLVLMALVGRSKPLLEYVCKEENIEVVLP
jgi:hypothetical protein